MVRSTPRTEAAVQLLQGLCEAGDIAACFLDESGTLAFANRAFFELARGCWRITPGELVGRDFQRAVPLPTPLRRGISRVVTQRRGEVLRAVPLGDPPGLWDVHLMPYLPEGRPSRGALMLFYVVDREREAGEGWAHTHELEALLADMGEAVLLVNRRGHVLARNQAAVQLFGLSGINRPVGLAELRRAVTLLDVNGLPLPAERSPLEAAARGLGLEARAYTLRRRAQPERHVRLRVTPMLGPDGRAESVLLIAQELPVAQRTRMAWGDPELWRFLDDAPASFFLLDRDTRVRFVNALALAQLGLPRGEVLGEPFPALLGLDAPREVTLRAAFDAPARRGAEPGPFPYRDRHTGELTYWEFVLLPVRDGGEAPRLLVHAVDATGRVKLERALEDQVRRLSTILAHIADGVMVLSPHDGLLMINDSARRLLHLPPDADASSLADLDVRTLSGQPVPPAEMPVMRILQGESVEKILLRVRNGHGDRVVAVSGTPLGGKRAGQRLGVIVLHDVTEEFHLRSALEDKVRQLQEAVDSLKELDRLKTDFLNAISHELRTPLTSIIGYTEFLEDGVAGPLNEQQAQFLHSVSRSSSHLLSLINDMIDYARLEAGELHFYLTPVGVAELVRQVAAEYAARAEEKRIELALDLPGELSPVRADAARLRQVLANLVDNALKFTEEGGKVMVSARAEGDAVRMEVADTGIGIPEEALPRMFSKFYQVESGMRRTQGGTGLGLAISKQLVEAQGGRIDLSSRPGEGTRVWVLVPIWRADEAAAGFPSEEGSC